MYGCGTVTSRDLDREEVTTQRAIPFLIATPDLVEIELLICGKDETHQHTLHCFSNSTTFLEDLQPKPPNTPICVGVEWIAVLQQMYRLMT